MPGVGVAPFGTGVIFVVSGIPGVGVPFGLLLIFMFAGSGIPGVELLESGTGLVENPAGKFAGLFAAAFVFAFVFVVSTELQAEFIAIKASIKINKAFFDIKIKTSQICILYLKYSCAGLNVASLEDSDGTQTGTGRYQTDSEGMQPT
jgi:hypothetical protein